MLDIVVKSVSFMYECMHVWLHNGNHVVGVWSSGDLMPADLML